MKTSSHRGGMQASCGCHYIMPCTHIRLIPVHIRRPPPPTVVYERVVPVYYERDISVVYERQPLPQPVFVEYSSAEEEEEEPSWHGWDDDPIDPMDPMDPIEPGARSAGSGAIRVAGGYRLYGDRVKTEGLYGGKSMSRRSSASAFSSPEYDEEVDELRRSAFGRSVARSRTHARGTHGRDWSGAPAQRTDSSHALRRPHPPLSSWR